MHSHTSSCLYPSTLPLQPDRDATFAALRMFTVQSTWEDRWSSTISMCCTRVFNQVCILVFETLTLTATTRLMLCYVSTRSESRLQEEASAWRKQHVHKGCREGCRGKGEATRAEERQQQHREFWCHTSKNSQQMRDMIATDLTIWKALREVIVSVYVDLHIKHLSFCCTVFQIWLFNVSNQELCHISHRFIQCSTYLEARLHLQSYLVLVVKL